MSACDQGRNRIIPCIGSVGAYPATPIGTIEGEVTNSPTASRDVRPEGVTVIFAGSVFTTAASSDREQIGRSAFDTGS